MHSVRTASRFVALSAGFLVFAASTFAAHWPAWRGPAGDGSSPEKNVPLQWSATENVRWKIELPEPGDSSPVIWGDKIFLTQAFEKEGGRTVTCYDRRDGKLLWKSGTTWTQAEKRYGKNPYCAASPVTDGEHVIASFGSRGVYGLDMKGRVLWSKDLGRMQTRNGFGEGSSPALSGNTVVILWDHEGDDFIVALDKRDGRELWRRQRDEPTGWCTPLVVEHDGRRQVVVNGTNKARSYDLETGDLVWEAGGQTVNAIPSVVSGHGRVYVTSGYRGAALQAIQLGRKGDLTATDAIAWSHGKGTPYVPSPLLAGDWLYLYSGNSGILSIFDAKAGKPVLDMARVEGLGGVYASPVAADGRAYLVGRDGVTVVAKLGPTLDVLARNTLDDGFDASPALVGGDLLLRGRKHLYCIGQ